MVTLVIQLATLVMGYYLGWLSHTIINRRDERHTDSPE